ncbi:MAG: ribosome biogenesis GTPase Der [Gammaproteobacteria bacterium]|nr:MAG: ribosome biogenesis GTPase Der [Gammaproteobacteria bacterium]
MIPVIALLGRPNVGKSTLFNYLTKSRDALVADYPGLTRDRKYGRGKVGSYPYIVVDTGGLADDPDSIEELMAKQVEFAVGEADAVIFLVDGRNGLTASDEMIANHLRRLGKKVQLVLNKTEGLTKDEVAADFYSLAIGDPIAISAAHGQGVKAMLQQLSEHLILDKNLEFDSDKEHPGIRIAVVGRPNVGKSTLVNRLLGEERVVTFDMPGTTRDSIFIPFEKDGEEYTLIDTAGVRRKSRVKESIEKFSVIKTLQALEAANVVIMVLDARQGISEQDATIIGHIIESGRALIIAVNKWDGLDRYDKDVVKMDIERKLKFLDFVEYHYISALHGSGVGKLLSEIKKVYKSAVTDISTSALTRVLEAAVIDHQPPLIKGRRIKLRYAHQGGKNPPVIVIHGNQTNAVPESYRRYLTNVFRKAFKMKGTPVRVEFKVGKNPFSSKKPKKAASGKNRKRER